MHIAFFCLPEHGGFVPTFILTRHLLSLGHRVTYFGPLDYEERVRAQGFDYVTLFADELRKGTIDQDAVNDGEDGSLKMVRRHLRHIAGLGQWETLEALANNTFPDLLRRHEVDLVLVDALFSFMVPLIAVSGIPYQVYLTELSGARGDGLPPSYSGEFPAGGTLVGAWRVRLAWARSIPRTWLRRSMIAIMYQVMFFGIPRPPRRLIRGIARSVRESAQRAGLRRSRWEYGWRWADADTVLCPAAFDFAEARAERTYLGPCIDHTRTDWDFPWAEMEQRRDGRRLVLVSLGTHAAQYAGVTPRFLRKVFEVASDSPDLFFVVVLGKGRSVDSIAHPPQNVMTFQFVPQLALLERTDAMITNGGLGTVKECIWFGVPMVVAPCRFDQPGNAARVLRHGIGRHVDVARVKPAQLRQALLDCLDDPGIAAAMAGMRAAFHASRELESWLDKVGAASAPEPATG